MYLTYEVLSIALDRQFLVPKITNVDNTKVLFLFSSFVREIFTLVISTTLNEETFARRKHREILGIYFREWPIQIYLARINIREWGKSKKYQESLLIASLIKEHFVMFFETFSSQAHLSL